MTKLDEALQEVKNEEASQNIENGVDQTESEPKTPSEKEQKAADRAFKLAMAKAYKERNEKIKENKEMLAEMEMEVRYWKAKRDLTVYRFDMMEYYLKNLEIEPKYLAAIEALKAKEAAAQSKPQIIQ